MNYYERHLGDYARHRPPDAGRARRLQPADGSLLRHRAAHSARARLPHRQGRHARRGGLVLREFFTLVDGAWTKGRIEEEIVRAQAKIKAAQENGRKGGRLRKQTCDKPAGFAGESGDEAHHSPATSLQPVVNELNATHTVCSAEGARTAGEVDRRFAGAICRRVIELGIKPASCNPAHPLLAALMQAGAQLAEFDGAARSELARGNRKFAYVHGIVKRQREEAAGLTLHQGALPKAAQKPWFLTSSGIEAKAAELNVVQDHDDSFPHFKERVFAAAGVTQETLSAATRDFA